MERHMLCLILLLFTTYYFLFQKKNMNVGDEWVGWAMPTKVLPDKIVNSILTRGGRFCPPYYYLPTQL